MFSVTQNGVALNPSKYTWDEATKVFGTNENNLVLDFSEYHGATFKTGWNCTFEVGEKCCLHYTWNDCFEVYKLVPKKIVKLLGDGKLQDVRKEFLRKNKKFLEKALENPGHCLLHTSSDNEEHRNISQAFLKSETVTLKTSFDIYWNFLKTNKEKIA